MIEPHLFALPTDAQGLCGYCGKDLLDEIHTFVQSGQVDYEPSLPAVLNARYVAGWNEAIEAAAKLFDGLYFGVFTHPSPQVRKLKIETTVPPAAP